MKPGHEVGQLGFAHRGLQSVRHTIGGGGGGLKHIVDFRSVYATALEKWLGIPSEPVLGKYPLLDIIA